MTTRTVRWVAVALLASAASPARAVLWQGLVGLTYSRDDLYEPRVTTPRLDVDLGLNLQGVIYDPNAFDYNLGAQYRRTTAGFNDAGGVRSQLDYHLNSTFFGARASPVTLRLNASQRQDDFGGAGGAGEFSSTSRSYGADLKLYVAGPALNFGFGRSEDEQTVPTLPDIRRTTDYVSASVGQGGGNFSYNARYWGAFHEGTFAGDNSDEHRLTLNGRADLDPRTIVQFTDEFYRREATEVSAFNPHQESNTFQTSVNLYASQRDWHHATYTYTRGVQLTPGSPDIERIGHSAAYGYDHVLDNPEWRLTTLVDATFAQDRLGADEQRTAGQSLGSLAQWRRVTERRSLEVRAGPTVGVLEAAGDTKLGYGASGGTSIVFPGEVTWQLVYDAAYASDIGNAGWNLHQSAYGSADLPLGTGHVSASLQAAGEYRSSPLFGAGGTRSFSARLYYSRARFNTNVVASVTSGLTNPVTAAGGRGILLALPYDSHVYTLTAAATAALGRGFSTSAELTAQSMLAVDRPTRDDLRASARLAYSVAALSLAIEDRYAITTSPGVDVRSNTLLVTATRAFRGGF